MPSHPTIKRKSKTSEHWNTPAWTLEVVRNFSRIGLDPCSNRWSLVDAHTSWVKSHDGLSRCWCGRGLVFMNPPYSRGNLPKWVPYAASEGDEVIGLVPAATDTNWWKTGVWRAAQAVTFVEGRITYLDKGKPVLDKKGRITPAPHASALVYWGSRPARFQAATRGVGEVMRLANK